jgi:hypothetical protein
MFYQHPNTSNGALRGAGSSLLMNYLKPLGQQQPAQPGPAPAAAPAPGQPQQPPPSSGFSPDVAHQQSGGLLRNL